MLTTPANFPAAINTIDKIYHHLNKKIPKTIVTGTHIQVANTIQEPKLNDEFDQDFLQLPHTIPPFKLDSIYNWSNYILYPLHQANNDLWPIGGIEFTNVLNQIENPSELQKLQKELAPHCSWWIPFKNHLFICDKPKTICFQENQFHNPNGPAIELRCGHKVYILNNVAINENVVLNPQSITIENIENEWHDPRKKIYIQAYGLEKFLQEKTISKIDQQNYIVQLKNKKYLIKILDNQDFLIEG